jgi:hypothetical protein
VAAVATLAFLPARVRRSAAAPGSRPAVQS